MRNILVLPANSIGDTILLSGSIAYLRSQFPKAKITIAVNNNTKALFRTIPEPVEFVPFPREKYNLHWVKLFNRLRGTAWDGILDIRRSALGLVLRYKKIWTIPRMRGHMHQSDLSNIIFNTTLLPKIWPAVPDESQRLLMSGSLLWITFGLAATRLTRSWPAERFFAVADRLLSADANLGIVFLAAPYTRKRFPDSQLESLVARYPGRFIDAVGTYDFETALCFLQLSDLVVTVDSGPLHIAAALDKPLIALFGPTEESMTGPVKQQPSSVHHIIRALPPFTSIERRDIDHDSYSEQMLAIEEAVVFGKVTEVVSSIRNQRTSKSQMAKKTRN